MMRRVHAVVCCAVFYAASLAAADNVTYDDHVVPILRNHCFNCHNSEKKKADLDASTYNGIMAGGGSGKVVLPSDANGSLLWKLINHLAEPNMPPKSPKLPEPELAVIRKWIEGGLLENSGSKALTGNKPKIDLAVSAGALGRPAGLPPMPGPDLRLEPVTRAARPGAITALATSPWAPLVAVAGQHQILLYNIDSLRIEGILPFPEGFPYVLKFSQSGRLLLAGGGVGAKMGKVVLFDVGSGKRVAEVGDEFDAVLAADLSPDQSRVALGGPTKTVRIYGTSDAKVIHTIKKHTDWITDIAYSPDGVLLATADRAGGVHLWEAESANAYGELKSSNPQTITSLSWRDDANVIATAGEDGQIRLWQVENSARLQSWSANAGGVLDMHFSHDNRLVSVGRDRTARLWDANGGVVRAFEAFGDIGLVTAISHDMARIVAGDYSGELRVWNAADGKLLGKLDPNPPTLAQRIEADTKRLLELTNKHSQLSAAHSAAQDAHAKAVAAADAARRDATNAAAAVMSAETVVNAAKQSLAQLTATRDASQKDAVAKQAEVTAKQAALAAAQESLAKAQAVAKSTQEAVAAADSTLRTATEAHTKAKAAADASPGVAQLADAATQAKAAADQAGAALGALQKGSTEQTSRMKAGEGALSTAQAALATAQTNYTTAQRAFVTASASITNAELALKTSTEKLQQAKSAAATSTNAATAAQTQATAASNALAQAKSKMEAAAAEAAAIKKDLVRWKAAQFNLQVLAAGDELDRKATASQQAEARAGELKMAADRADAELAGLRKAIADAPGVIVARSQAVVQAQAALDSAKGALPNLQRDLGVRDADAAAAAAALAKAAEVLGKGQATLKALEENAATSVQSSNASAVAAAKAKATAAAHAGVGTIAEAAAKAEQAAAESAAACALANKAAVEYGPEAKRLSEAHAKAKSVADVTAGAAAAARKALEAQPAAIKAAEVALTAAQAELTKAHASPAELAKKLPESEKAVAAATTVATAARQAADQLAAEVAALKTKHQQLVADYSRLKTG